MYIKKSILVALILIKLALVAYILVEERVILANDGTENTSFYLEIQSTEPPLPQMTPLNRVVSEEDGWLPFEATAYCTFGITKTGVWVQRGIIAVDPSVIPLGSIVEIQAGPYSGLYTAMDTGAVIKDRLIDIYMPSWEEAVRFGRQSIKMRVIRKGWNPGFHVDASLADGLRVER
ncbi:MAG: 3D domain-containing protein [Acidobacteria bacterium]|nr:3D domain-containing protein [Acidobacteriota bacterium]